MLSLTAAFSSFYGCIIFHCIRMYHIFFILSSVDGHFGSFHVLVTVDNAAVRAWDCRYLLEIMISFPVGIYPEAGLQIMGCFMF